MPIPFSIRLFFLGFISTRSQNPFEILLWLALSFSFFPFKRFYFAFGYILLRNSFFILFYNFFYCFFSFEEFFKLSPGFSIYFLLVFKVHSFLGFKLFLIYYNFYLEAINAKGWQENYSLDILSSFKRSLLNLVPSFFFWSNHDWGLEGREINVR